MNTTDLRVLSIRQPWSELILSHGKNVENRTWTTSWRGLVVVHAGQRCDPCGAPSAIEHGVPLGRRLPTGYLGVVELTGVHRDAGCCRPWGQPGTYHWQLASPHQFPTPVPAAGRLGLHRPAPLWAARLHRLLSELDTNAGGIGRE